MRETQKVSIKCEICGISFLRKPTEIKRSERLGRKHYCSLSCAGKANVKRNIGDKAIGWHPNFRRNTDLYSPFRKIIYGAKNRAKSYGRTFDLTLEDLKKQWERQNGVCPYTGWELVLSESSTITRAKSIKNASLDRIDSSKGYTKDNIQFVAWIANLAKNNFQESELLEFCLAVVKKRQMNTNTKFLNEAKELEAHWAKSGLLEGIDKKYDRSTTAVMLECQRLHNETGTWDCCDECREREKNEMAKVDVVSDVS